MAEVRRGRRSRGRTATRRREGGRPGARVAGWAVLAFALAGGAVFAALHFADRAAPPAAPPPTPVAPAPAAPERASFVGSQACGSCHASEMQAWRGSQHDLAMQEMTPDTVLGDFENASFEHFGVKTRFTRRDGRYFVETDGPDGKPAEFEARYTFGVDPLQQYLVQLPGGRLQAFWIAWDTRPRSAGGGRWFALYPHEAIRAGDRLHWTGIDQNWNFMCADCHSTNVERRYDAAHDRFDTTWSEIAVGCEACHGPGSAHVAWAALPPAERSAAPTAAPAGLTVAQRDRRDVVWRLDPATGNSTRTPPAHGGREIETCAPCHARRSQIAEGWKAGDAFLDHYLPATLSPPLYHVDGQQDDEVYVWGSFLQSRMYAHGVTCSDCHDPHSLRLRAEGNALCGSCHDPAKYDVAAHHFHPAGSAGAQCASCHMPAKTYMQIDPRRDHSFRVPRPDQTVAFGTPNACNGCHADRSPAWAAKELRRRTGHDPQGFQTFAPAFDASRRHSADAGPQLLALLADEAQPALVRATAASLLGPSLTQESVQTLVSAVYDESPLVRREALQPLAGLPAQARVALVAPLLSDPVRAVRMEAAMTLADVPAERLDPAQRAAFDRAVRELEDTAATFADRPENRSAHAGFLARRGQTAEAEAEYRAALAIDPRFVPAWANLADLLRTQSRDPDAAEVLREGLAASPNDASLHHTLGLTWIRLGRREDATREFARAAQLAPGDARFAYVYAVALNSSGHAKEALRELDRALALTPDDRDLLFAAVTMRRDAGDTAGAKRFAARLAERYPGDRSAAQLLGELSPAGPNEGGRPE